MSARAGAGTKGNLFPQSLPPAHACHRKHELTQKACRRSAPHNLSTSNLCTPPYIALTQRHTTPGEEHRSMPFQGHTHTNPGAQANLPGAHARRRQSMLRHHFKWGHPGPTHSQQPAYARRAGGRWSTGAALANCP